MPGSLVYHQVPAIYSMKDAMHKSLTNLHRRLSDLRFQTPKQMSKNRCKTMKVFMGNYFIPEKPRPTQTSPNAVTKECASSKNCMNMHTSWKIGITTSAIYPKNMRSDRKAPLKTHRPPQ